MVQFPVQKSQPGGRPLAEVDLTANPKYRHSFTMQIDEAHCPFIPIVDRRQCGIGLNSQNIVFRRNLKLQIEQRPDRNANHNYAYAETD